MQDFTRYGPWCLITGASAGLGSCYARQLAAHHLNLVLVARRGDRLEALADELRRDYGIEVRCLALDLLAPDAPLQLQAETEGLEIGLLVNNAGFGFKGDFLDFWDAALWLFAFVFIELNVFEWQQEIRDQSSDVLPTP